MTVSPPKGLKFENSIIPGIEISGSLILTQKCLLTDRFSLKTRQQTPMFAIESYRAFQSSGNDGIMDVTSGVGTVEMTTSALRLPLGVATPVTLPSSTSTLHTGHLRRISPPRSRIAEQRASTRVCEPPSMYPSSSCIIELRDRPTRLMRVHIHAAEILSA